MSTFSNMIGNQRMGGGAGINANKFDALAANVQNMKNFFDKLNNKPQVDRDFIVNQIRSLKNELLNGGAGGSGDVNNKLNKIEELLANNPTVPASGSSSGSSSGSPSSTGGWSWWVYIVALLVVGGAGFAFYKYKQKNNRRQFKLL
jgi:uncharacterized protein HemX